VNGKKWQIFVFSSSGNGNRYKNAFLIMRKFFPFLLLLSKNVQIRRKKLSEIFNEIITKVFSEVSIEKFSFFWSWPKKNYFSYHLTFIFKISHIFSSTKYVLPVKMFSKRITSSSCFCFQKLSRWSISSTFYVEILCTKVFSAAFSTCM